MRFLSLIVLVLLFVSHIHAQPHVTNTTENQHNPALQQCWLHSPMPTECNDNTTLGGNIAFPAMFSIPILRSADSLTSKFAAFQPSEWKSSNDALSYHVSIDYMFCVPKQYTDLVHVGMRTLEWNSMSLTTSHACCEPGHLQLCLDDESSLKMAAFAQHVRTHLRSLGIPVPDYAAYQPPFHISLGSTSMNYNWTAALAEIDHSTSITFQVDVLYFGSKVYRADDWFWSISKSGGSAQFLFIVFLILLMLGIILNIFGKYLLRRCRNSKKSSIQTTNNDKMTTVTVPMNSIIVLPYNDSTDMASSTTATASDLLHPLLPTTSTSTSTSPSASASASFPVSPSLSLQLSDEHPTPDPDHPHPALHLEELFSPTHIQFHLDTERSQKNAYLFSPSQLHIHH